MLRPAVALALLLSVPALADDKAPLPPGRPAGVHQARFVANYPVIFTATALALVVGGIYLASKDKNSGSTTGTSP